MRGISLIFAGVLEGNTSFAAAAYTATAGRRRPLNVCVSPQYVLKLASQGEFVEFLISESVNDSLS